MARTHNEHLYGDVLLICFSVGVAVLIARSGVVHELLEPLGALGWISSFFAGLFFTSVFTTAPAIVALGEISQGQPLWLVAALGAAGAVVGDVIIFRFLRDHMADRLGSMLQNKSIRMRFKSLIRLKFFRYFTFLLGGIIIASPLPDELGLGLVGFSKVGEKPLIILSYIFNFLGIVAIGLATGALT